MAPVTLLLLSVTEEGGCAILVSALSARSARDRVVSALSARSQIWIFANDRAPIVRNTTATTESTAAFVA